MLKVDINPVFNLVYIGSYVGGASPALSRDTGCGLELANFGAHGKGTQLQTVVVPLKDRNAVCGGAGSRKHPTAD